MLTFFQFPTRQWKTLRTTNVIERFKEFRRHVKTQGALPTEDAALVLLFGLVLCCDYHPAHGKAVVRPRMGQADLAQTKER